jgi:hypothetical protein
MEFLKGPLNREGQVDSLLCRMKNLFGTGLEEEATVIHVFKVCSSFMSLCCYHEGELYFPAEIEKTCISTLCKKCSLHLFVLFLYSCL